jgi:hypothetical protein
MALSLPTKGFLLEKSFGACVRLVLCHHGVFTCGSARDGSEGYGCLRKPPDPATRTGLDSAGNY